MVDASKLDRKAAATPAPGQRESEVSAELEAGIAAPEVITPIAADLAAQQAEAQAEKTPSNLQIRSFFDRELATLAGHLIENVKPENLHKQNDFNLSFDQLGLDRFITNRGVVDLNKLAVRLTPYTVDTGVIAYLVEALNGPMNGRVTRAIGAGSAFFSRLLAPRSPSSASSTRLAAVPKADAS